MKLLFPKYSLKWAILDKGAMNRQIDQRKVDREKLQHSNNQKGVLLELQYEITDLSGKI